MAEFIPVGKNKPSAVVKATLPAVTPTEVPEIPLSLIPWRLFVSTWPSVFANLRANPGVRNTLWANKAIYSPLQTPLTQLSQLVQVKREAEDLGFHFATGFRCMEVNLEGLGWLSPAIWARNTTYLQAILDTLPVTKGLKLLLDVEDYQSGTPRATDYGQLARVMAPFLKLIRESGVRFGFYPANIEELSTLVLGDNVGGDLEVWDELSFGLSEQVRLNDRPDGKVALLAGVRHHFQQRWPLCRVRHGEFDHFDRDWGVFGRQDLSVYGECGPWLFDRLRQDNSALGTPAWQTGSTLQGPTGNSGSMANDPVHIWNFEGYPQVQVANSMILGGTMITSVQYVASSLRTDLAAYDLLNSRLIGYLVSAGRGLTASGVYPTAAQGSTSATLLVDVMLPVGATSGPIFGAAQANSRTWQVLYDAALDRIVFQIRASGVITNIVMQSAPPKGTFLRLAVAFDMATSSWRVNSVDAPTVVAGSTIFGAGTLYFGAGIVDLAVSPGVVNTSEGYVFRYAELFHRYLTLTEYTRLRSQDFPRTSA